MVVPLPATPSLNPVYNLLHTARNSLSVLNPAVNALDTDLKNLLELVVKSLNSLSHSLVPVTNVSSSITSLLGNVAGNILGSWLQSANQLIGGLLDEVRDAQNLLDSSIDGSSDIENQLVNLLQGAIRNSTNCLNQFTTNIVGGVDNVTSVVQPAIASATVPSTGLLGGVLNGVLRIVCKNLFFLPLIVNNYYFCFFRSTVYWSL